MRIHHVAVQAADIDASVAFYRAALGCGEPYWWNHPPIVARAAFLQLPGGGWIELFDASERERPAGPGAMDHVALAVEDVQAACERAVAAGARLLDGPVTRTLHGEPPREATMAFLAGPDGEVIELYRNDAFA